MTIFSDWRVLMAVYIISSGLWGFLLKYVLRELDWKTTMFYVWTTVYLFFVIFLFRNINFGTSKFHMLSVIIGLLGATGTIAFYKAVDIMPASIIIPLSSTYIIITVALSVIFLHEPLTAKTILGIVLGLISIILLTT